MGVKSLSKPCEVCGEILVFPEERRVRRFPSLDFGCTDWFSYPAAESERRERRPEKIANAMN